MLYNTENPHGGDVYAGAVELDFSANTNPFGTPEGVQAAIARAASELHRYPDPYCRELVSAISAYEGVPNEYVLCGNGAAELIYSYCEAARPSLALELAPTFSEYSSSLQRAGCRVLRHALLEEEGFAVTERLIEDVRRLRPDAVFICDPNNPTGRLMDETLKAELLNVCGSLGIRLFADECFIDLAGGTSFSKQTHAHPQLAVLKAFTKSFGMAGARLGYVLSSDGALLEKMSRTVQPWNVSSLAQRAGTAALSESGFIEKTRRLFEIERPRLARGLSGLGLNVYASDANFLLFRGEPGLCEALAKQGIKLRDCSNFEGLGSGFCRAAVKLPGENDRLIDAIRGVLWQKT